MKLLFDFFPIILFFVAYKLGDIFIATTVAIVATLIQLLYGRIRHGMYEKSHLISFALILVLGSATLLLKDAMFIKWKTTAVYWVLGLMFLASQFFGKKSLIEHIAGHSIAIKKTIWKKLNISWGVFFIGMGFINLYVVYHFDTDTWVNFKLFGTLGLTLLFVLGQGLYMAKHLEQDKEKRCND